jgi:hypothetical protein
VGLLERWGLFGGGAYFVGRELNLGGRFLESFITECA